MDGNFMLLPRQVLDKDSFLQVMDCNQKTEEYGLSLSPVEAMELVQTRNFALSSWGRMEFGGGILTKLIAVFQDSPYLYQKNYAQTLHELVETFYYFKNESLDQISDDDLLAYMKNCFDTVCAGSIELLQCRELEKMAHNIRFGTEGSEGQEPEGEEGQEDE